MKVQVMVPVNVDVEIRCERGGHKFVVVEDDYEGLAVYADDDPEFMHHRDLWTVVARKFRGAMCIGGGLIEVDRVEKAIRIFGSSGDFGREPDRNVTLAAIKLAYPDYEVTSELK